eukprot:TRINITY_DN2244_c0_g2_i3.p1 TRINITY_DN2244_c0_g2~~TRINITY_DN2244_c0_g2_i3.p1  ORF type:complete len:298 (+),score=30.62 TRINITY_DN2244_c0_g2_i3:75-968(+)
MEPQGATSSFSGQPRIGQNASGALQALAGAGAFPVPAEHDSESFVRNVSGNRNRLRSMSIAADVVEELERTNPGVLTYLESTAGFILQGSVLLMYVVFEVAGGVLNSRVLKAKKGEVQPLASSLIVVNSFSSIVLGSVLTAGLIKFSDERPSLAQTAKRTFTAVMDWRQIASCAFVATCFSVASVFSMLTYSKLDAGLKRIIDQLRLPTTAALSATIVGRSYNRFEWCTLLVILLTVICFYSADVDQKSITELRAACYHPQVCFPDKTPYDICALSVQVIDLRVLCLMREAFKTLHT